MAHESHNTPTFFGGGVHDGGTQRTVPLSQMNTQGLTNQGSMWLDPRVWGGLVTVHGEGRHRLMDVPATLGRINTCSVVIPDDRVSSTHCTIYPPRWFQQKQLNKSNDSQSSSVAVPSPDDLPYVMDKSLNGTFVNRKKVPHGKTCKLRSGDEISIVLQKTKRPRGDGGVDDGKEFLQTFVFQDFSRILLRRTELRSSLPPNSTPGTQLDGAWTPSLSAMSQSAGLGNTPHRHGSNTAATSSANAGLMANLERGISTKHPLAAAAAAVSANGSSTPSSRTDGSAPAPPSAGMPPLAPQRQATQELPHIDWQWGNLIGKGAASDVYVGIDVSSGCMIAIKRLHKVKPGSPGLDQARAVDNIGVETPSFNDASSWIAEVPMDDEDAADGRADTPTLAKRNSSANAKGLIVTPEVEAELNLLKSLTHRRIVQYLGFAVDERDHVCILLEYVSGGSLQSLITNFGSFLEPIVRIYAMQILQGIEFLHQNGVVHGDIKPANILLSDKGQIKLSDFGTSRMIRPPQQQHQHNHHTHALQAQQPSSSGELVGTPLWMSPDFVRTQIPTFESDIWAFGCVCLQMATGQQPWAERNFTNPVTTVFQIGMSTSGPSLAGLHEIGASSDLISFVQEALTIDPHFRPTATELLQHPFILGSAGGGSDGRSRYTAPSAFVGDQACNAVNYAEVPAFAEDGGPGVDAQRTAGGGSSPLSTDLRTAGPTSDNDECSPLQRGSAAQFSIGSGIGGGSGSHQSSLDDHIAFVRTQSSAVNRPIPLGGAARAGPVAVPGGVTAGGLALSGVSSGLTEKMKRL